MAESILLGVLGKDFGDNVFKYLAPRTLARLETTFTSELVFVQPGGVQALLLSVAQRRHAAVRGSRYLKTLSPKSLLSTPSSIDSTIP
jgi:hypothetical protein